MPRPLKASPKAWWNMVFLSGLLYGLPMGVVFSLLAGNWKLGFPLGLIAGVMFGVVFTMATRWFSDRQIDRCQQQTPDLGDETIQLEGPANLFRGKEGVGGYLWLTESRLLFRSHRLNVQSGPWETSVSEIASAQSTKTMGLLDNGLQVQLSSGDKVRFVVNKNRFWADAIQEVMAAARPDSSEGC